MNCIKSYLVVNLYFVFVLIRFNKTFVSIKLDEMFNECLIELLLFGNIGIAVKRQNFVTWKK